MARIKYNIIVDGYHPGLYACSGKWVQHILAFIWNMVKIYKYIDAMLSYSFCYSYYIKMFVSSWYPDILII